jgi:hypothetical protein
LTIWSFSNAVKMQKLLVIFFFQFISAPRLHFLLRLRRRRQLRHQGLLQAGRRHNQSDGLEHGGKAGELRRRLHPARPAVLELHPDPDSSGNEREEEPGLRIPRRQPGPNVIKPFASEIYECS